MCVYRVATFNLKSDMLLTRSFLRWNTRKDSVIQCIKEMDADILGVQELTLAMSKSLQPLMQLYSHVGKSRNKTPRDSSEKTDIFYKTSKFNCLQYKTFWLSNSPDKEGSRLFFSPFPRICTVAQLQDKKTKEILWVFNTHLDHLLSYNRTKETKILIDKLTTENNVKNIILMGDLNTNQESAAIKYLLTNPRFPLKSVYKSTVSNTMHYGNGKIKKNALPIDYIFIGSEFEVLSTEIIKNHFNGQYPSDHYPVLSEIKFK